MRRASPRCFDGKSLNGWDGDPKYWLVADGLMTGEITPETVVKSRDFVLASEPKEPRRPRPTSKVRLRFRSLLGMPHNQPKKRRTDADSASVTFSGHLGLLRHDGG
jgi:hypothetical protein